MSNQPNRSHSLLLAGTALFAFLWTLARAAVQAITIDEADTYLASVAPPTPMHWNPTANNHVLNSMLARLSTTIFGASAITLRLPALLGALLYIGAAYCLARLLTASRWLQWAILACLTLSPFVMDYLAAARGYALASAFLLWMVVVAADHKARDPKPRLAQLDRTCALISVCAALSIAANFSFAVADGLLAIWLFFWILNDYRHEIARILACFLVPGLAVGYFLVGSVVRAWPKGQFTWGAGSFFQMISSLVSASLFQPNEYLLHPRLRHYFVHFGTWLYPLLAAFLLWRVVMLMVERRRNTLALVLGSVLLAALALHELLFHALAIKLPLDRTALWIAVLFLALAGALAAAPLETFAGRMSGHAMTGVLVLIAIYNLGCLRLTYFNEWKYDADMQTIYRLLAFYNHTYGLTRVSTNWRYVAALNCYRQMSGQETLAPIPSAPTEVGQYPPGYQAYVFFYPSEQDFYKRDGLLLVYHNSFTQAAVALLPQFPASPNVSPQQ